MHTLQLRRYAWCECGGLLPGRLRAQVKATGARCVALAWPGCCRWLSRRSRVLLPPFRCWLRRGSATERWPRGCPAAASSAKAAARSVPAAPAFSFSSSAFAVHPALLLAYVRVACDFFLGLGGLRPFVQAFGSFASSLLNRSLWSSRLCGCCASTVLQDGAQSKAACQGCTSM